MDNISLGAIIAIANKINGGGGGGGAAIVGSAIVGTATAG